MSSIWHNFDGPIWCLAPMEGVTDSVFRRIIDSCGRPDLKFSEFTSVEGMASVGDEEVSRRLRFEPSEKPLIAQIWGLDTNLFTKAAERLVAMGFDGVDINMGCPDKAVVKSGACSAMIDNPKLATKIIEAVKKGVQGHIPVSVKTRIGLKKVVTKDWTATLLDTGIDALTIHGRTAKQLSKVSADWEEIGKVVQVRDKMRVDTLIIGNGDVMSLDEANDKASRFGVDGVMIGRGIFADPWLFHPNESFDQKSVDEKLDLLLQHTQLFVSYWGQTRPFHVLRKYFKIYVNGFVGAKQLRTHLMKAENDEEVQTMIEDWKLRKTR